MHELSIALSILEIVEEQSHRRGDAGVAAVHIKLGPLSGVIGEALLSAFELARECSAFEKCDLIIEETPLIAFCPSCQEARNLDSVQLLLCPVCGVPTPEILSGRELEITAMEFEHDPANALS
jgi:hydrogenase nickel incorporation protein HypA/HybF